MLVVDIHVLRAVHVLDFPDQIPLERLFPLDSEDVMRHEGPVGQGIPRLHQVTGVDVQVAVPRNVVLFLHPAFAADGDRHLAFPLVAPQLDPPADFRHGGGVFRLAGLKHLRDAGQTAGDILRTACGPGLMGE